MMLKLELAIICLLVGIFSVMHSSRGIAADDNRLILALYDSKDDSFLESNAHLLLEMPLNRLGMVVEYHNVSDSHYPDVSKYRGVVVWLSDNKLEDGASYFEFLYDALDSGVKVILMNGVGITENLEGGGYDKESKVLLNKMGLEEGDVDYLENPFVVDYTKIKTDAFGFEVEDAVNIPTYRDFRIVNKNVKSWMNVSRSDVEGSEAVVVAVGPKGAFISDIEMVAQYVEDPVWGILWDLDPFVFFSDVLGLNKTLKPDVTTSFGLRSAFMHIDGDGSSNLTLDFPGSPVPCTKIIREELLAKYDFPVSASIVAYRLTEEGSLGQRFINELEEIMKMPIVQAASHTYAHPMVWSRGVLGFDIPGYTFDPVMETVGSMEVIKELALPEDKDIELLLWSGDCEATEASLAALDSAGFQNMNGGNARIDELYQGICHICPLTVQVGKYRQYYAPAGNEYLYTDGWIDNFGGFVRVIDTFENSKKPRYLPVDVYYHYYLGERQAGLRSLVQIYDWCKTQELCWIHVGEYTRSITGFLSAQTGIDDSGNYYIENYTGLNTVRLDNEDRNVDLAKSRNVIGYNHFDGSLYVSLNKGDRAEIVLTDKPSTGLYIKGCTSAVKDFQRNESGIKAKIRLYSEGFIEFSGVDKGKVVKIAGKSVTPLAGSRDRYHISRGSGEWVELEVGLE